ncbi:vanin-like protein 3 [Drosophila virilis]|nr:vanin-like protein 3 [Drosophila virilis]
MCGKLWSLLHLLCLALASCGAASDEYYTAGVAEFRPALTGGSSEQLLQENLSAYLELIEAANGTADILVFPEGTLNSQLQLTAVPAPSRRTLCHITTGYEVHDFLRQLACAALVAHSYLVVNVKERENCAPDNDCPARGYRLYNTNVVLDRGGAVVSRYRKWNLYLEPQLNRTRAPEYAIFNTDFNVTFGHFICFDMLFYTPAQELVERYDLQHLIVSNMFKSELPFLTASQLQQGWAWANNVNLLAAGASLPHGGITGSGIYAGRRGALVRRMVGDTATGERQLLLARVPRWPRLESSALELDAERWGPAQLQLEMLQQPQLEEFNSWQVPLLNGSLQQQRLCQADLCCDFELQTELEAAARTTYNYRLGVFVGQRRYEEEEYTVVRLCGLFACRNDSILSCGLLAEQPAEPSPEPRAAVLFRRLRVAGEFVQRPRRLLMPSTLSGALYALQATEIDWSVRPDAEGAWRGELVTQVQLVLKKSHSQLLTFAIYGNYFDEYAADGQGGGGGGGGGVISQLTGGVWGMAVGLLLSYHAANR